MCSLTCQLHILLYVLYKIVPSKKLVLFSLIYAHSINHKFRALAWPGDGNNKLVDHVWRILYVITWSLVLYVFITLQYLFMRFLT